VLSPSQQPSPGGSIESGPYSIAPFVPGAPAPEPASWAMMLAGFGLIGGAMRARRRTQVRFA